MNENDDLVNGRWSNKFYVAIDYNFCSFSHSTCQSLSQYSICYSISYSIGYSIDYSIGYSISYSIGYRLFGVWLCWW